MVATRDYHGGSLDMRGGYLHPLNLAIGIARAAIAAGATIHPHSAATRLARSGTGWRVTTARGSVTADTVLLACGGYLEGMNRAVDAHVMRSEEHTSELQSLMRISYAVFCLKKKKNNRQYAT